MDEPIARQRSGFRRVLERAGWDVGTVHGGDRSAVVAVVGRACALQLAAASSEHLDAGRLVIAIGGDRAADDAIRLLRLGVSSVLPRICPAARLMAALRGAVLGDVTIPAELVPSLVDVVHWNIECDERLGDQQRLWLQQLAEGSTIADLAVESGYSTRHMRRLLQSTSELLGAPTLTAAVAKAARYGLIGPARPAGTE